MSGVRAQTLAGNPGAAYRGGLSADRRRAESAVLVLAVGGAAAALPFVVVPAWYDAYYWPKVCVLYAAVGLGALQALRLEGAGWLRSFRDPLGAPLIVWLGALAAATALSVNPLLSVVGEDYRYEGLLTWLAYATLAALAARTLRSPRRLRVILVAILAAAGVMSVLALLQHGGLSPVPEDVVRRGWVRAWGTTGNPIALGAYTVLLFPLALALYAAENRPGRRLAYGALALLLYAAMIAAEARAAWGAFALGTSAWGLAVGSAAVRRAARHLAVLAILCAAVAPAVLLTGPLATGHALEQVPSAGDAVQRIFLWRTAAPLVLERPWLGWGPETLAQVYPAYGTPAFVRVFPAAATQSVIVDRPHNDLLQHAVAAGFVGLGAYVWLWYTVLRMTWRAARVRGAGDHGLRRGDDRRSLLVDPPVIAAGLFGGFVAYLAQLQLSFSYVSVAPVFWVLVGAAAALRPRVAWRGPALERLPRRGGPRV